MRRYIPLLVSLLFQGPIHAQTGREVRAVWVETAGGNDIAADITDFEQKQKSIDEMLDRLSSANFNTVILQVQHNGSVLWDSDIQPAMFSATGNADLPVRWDMCRYVIDACHKRGMECHALVSVYRLGTDTDIALYSDNAIKHPAEELADLTVRHDGIYYLNPGLPETGEYLVTLYRELMSNYDFDGINFDDIQYPSNNFDDLEAYRTYNPAGVPREQWRRENINDFVADVYDAVKEVAPRAKVGSSVVGTYRNAPGYGNPTGFGSYSQDACQWMQSGNHDLLIPRMFYTEGSGFSDNMLPWVSNSDGRQIVIGLSPRMMNRSDGWSVETIVRQFEKVRDQEGVSGICFYSAGDVIGSSERSKELYGILVDNLFRYPAHIPPMNYDGITTPGTPENVLVDYNDGRYTITWDEPSVSDVPVKYYTVYLRNGSENYTQDPRNEIAHFVTDTSFSYEPTEQGLEFSVTAFDINYNESLPAEASGVDVPGIDRSIDFRYAMGTITIYSGIPLESVDIFTMQGNHIRHIDTSGCDLTVNCDNLPGGMYIVTVTQCDGSRNVYKFVR